MAVNTTWSSPATAGGSGGIDLAAGDTLSETVWDRTASDLYRLGGTDGNAKTGPLQVGSTQAYSNANNTAGLTINQGAADDEALSLKSSDVAHGVTSLAETDTYGTLTKSVAASGGLSVTGISEGTGGVRLVGVHTTDDTTKGTGATGAVILDAFLKSGTGIAANGANSNLLVVRSNATTAKFIVDQEGDLHVDGSTTITAFDGEDDGALVEALSLVLDPSRGRDLRFRLATDLDAHREALLAGGVLSAGGFLSYKGVLGLLIDAIRQVTHAHRTLEARVAPLLPPTTL